MRQALWSLGVVAMTLLIPSPSALAQIPSQIPSVSQASQTFAETCSTCHGNPNVKNAPDIANLRELTPESIYAALTSGAMRIQAQNLSDGTKRALARYLSGREPGIEKIADAKFMPNQCPQNASFDLSAAPMWNGWGVDAMNTRFQPASAARLSASQVPQLKLKWAFGFPGATVVYNQPTIAGGRVFVASDTGYVYALDAATGCVYWSLQARAVVRSTISVGPVKGQPAKYAAYFGDMQSNVYAVDAIHGKLLWKVSAENHQAARITGAPKLFEGRLYVPVTSMEEGTGASLKYPCCTFRGSVVALDANTGRQIWKAYTIAEKIQPLGTNSEGVQLWGPSGGGVWNSPTVDVKRHAIYEGVGDAYSGQAPKTTDAVMAFDMKTGKTLWAAQHTENDTWITACGPSNSPGNCPKTLGPDYDFSASPILQTLPDGRRLLVVSQKSGIIFAHDPDRHGALVWKMNLAPTPPGPQGETVWGGAADEQNVYFGVNSGGVAALDLASGDRKWFTPINPPAALEGHRGQSGPISEIPGVVFSGGWDGVLRAFSRDDGHLLWQYDTVRGFETVNGVMAKGGSLGQNGLTIAGGMVFAGSGYVGVQNGMPGNVLLAFSAE